MFVLLHQVLTRGSARPGLRSRPQGQEHHEKNGRQNLERGYGTGETGADNQLPPFSFIRFRLVGDFGRELCGCREF